MPIKLNAFAVMFHESTTSDIKAVLHTNVDITGDYCDVAFTASSAWLIELSRSKWTLAQKNAPKPFNK